LDIGVLGYIGIVQHKEHSPEVLSIPPGTPCIYHNSISLYNVHSYMFRHLYVILREFRICALLSYINS